MKRFTVLLDGKPLSYLTGGSGQPLILLHTIGGSAAEYTRIAPYLSRHFQVIALDLPGHGESYPLDEFGPVPDIAQTIIHLLDELGLKQVNLAGNSLSGTNAIETAILYPERVEKIALISGTGPWADQPGLPKRYNLPTHSSENKEINWFRSQFHDPTRADEPGFFHWWVASRSRADDEMIRAWRRRPLLEQPLSACKAPVLLIIGEEDPLHPRAWAEAWLQLLPKGHLHVIPGVRHFLNLEAPEQLAAALISFFVGTESDPSWAPGS